MRVGTTVDCHSVILTKQRRLCYIGTGDAVGFISLQTSPLADKKVEMYQQAGRGARVTAYVEEVSM